MSFELTKPPSLLAPQRFLTGPGPSWNPAPGRRPQPCPKSPHRAGGGLIPTQTDRRWTSPPSPLTAREPGALASASRPAGRHSARSQAEKLITLGNSPRPTQDSPFPFLCTVQFSLHCLFTPLLSLPLVTPSLQLHLCLLPLPLPRWVTGTHAGCVSAVGALALLCYRYLGIWGRVGTSLFRRGRSLYWYNSLDV